MLTATERRLEVLRAVDRVAKGDTSNVIRGRGGISHRRGDAVVILAFRIVGTRQQECCSSGLPRMMCGRNDLTSSLVDDASVSGWDIATVAVMI